MLQQAPSSKLQPALLFSSSHLLSLDHWGDPQPDNVVDAVVVDVDAVVVDVDVFVVDVDAVVDEDAVVFVVSKHSQTCMKLTIFFLEITIRINNM